MRNLGIAITTIVASLLLAGTALADTINVPGDHTLIQDAINASSDGDVIIVAAGTYYESELTPNGKAITIQGTLNGNGSLATTIDAQQAGSVFYMDSGEDSGTIIQDLVITGGLDNYGGGIYCSSSSPTISGCTITGNTSNYSGGGIGCYINSNPTISGCTISGNTASWDGGGISCGESSPTITDCTISDNMSGTGGGGIFCTSSSPAITGCTISGNTATTYGGGIYCIYDSNPTITGCTISNNWADYGGGIYCRLGSNPTITDCMIEGNTADIYGGGIRCEDSNPTIIGCTITGNDADYGGGIYCEYGKPTLTGCTVCGNTPNQIYGNWIDEGGNTIAAVCSVPGACCTNDQCVIADEDECLVFYGQWLGEGTTCDDSPCPSDCLGDANGDGEVSVNDILLVISQYGVTCP